MRRLFLLAALLPVLTLLGCAAHLLKRRASSHDAAPALNNEDVIAVFGATSPLLTDYAAEEGKAYDGQVDGHVDGQVDGQVYSYASYAPKPTVDGDVVPLDDGVVASEGGEHPTADGLYSYLVEAGFQLSSPNALQNTRGAQHALTFVLADRSHVHRFQLYEFADAAGARALHAATNTHKLTSVCGPLVLIADFPLPRAQLAAGLENALDIYVAKAEHGLLGETRVAIADTSINLGRAPVRAARKMFMLSRDAVVYSEPSTSSSAIATVQEDNYVRVIDLLPSFLKVRLLDGAVGFVPESAVE